MTGRHRRRARLGASLLITVLANTGCSHAPDTGPVPPAARQTAQQNMSARIQDVQNNPGIPPEDKARMIGMMQSQMGAGGAKR